MDLLFYIWNKSCLKISSCYCIAFCQVLFYKSFYHYFLSHPMVPQANFLLLSASSSFFSGSRVSLASRSTSHKFVLIYLVPVAQGQILHSSPNLCCYLLYVCPLIRSACLENVSFQMLFLKFCPFLLLVHPSHAAVLPFDFFLWIKISIMIALQS